MLSEFDGEFLSGGVEAVESGRDAGRDVVGAEIAGLVGFAVKVHGDEIADVDFFDEVSCAICITGTNEGVDGKEGEVDDRVLGGYAADNGVEFGDHGLRILFFGFFVEVIGCEVASMQDDFAVLSGDDIGDAGFGGAEGFDDRAGAEDVLDAVAGREGGYIFFGVAYAAHYLTSGYVNARMVLCQVEDVGVVVRGMGSGGEEDDGESGVMFKFLDEAMRRVAIIIEYVNDLVGADNESGIVEISYLSHDVVF